MEFAGAVVSTEDFISSAKEQLGVETSDYDIWFEKLAQEGIRHLNCLSLLKKEVCEFDICDGKVKLPCNFHRLLGLRMGSGSDCEDAIYVDLDFIKSCGCDNLDNTSNYINFFEIDDGFIHFHGDIEGFTKATVAFTGYHVDDNGLLIGQADYERAVTAYICWKFTMRNFEKFPRYIQKEYQQEWIVQKKWVRSGDFQKSFQDTKAQVKEWANAMVAQQSPWVYSYYPTQVPGITTTISD